jgi:bifunctional DNA-binding transcriptional regulator/antitoxin component of YhaV-PrlF toxin-antitoxin module
MTETVSLDSTGKMYFPQKVREQMKTKEFTPLVMPGGEIVLQPIFSPLSAKEKLILIKKMGLWKTKKSIRELREGLYEEVGKRFER